MKLHGIVNKPASAILPVTLFLVVWIAGVVLRDYAFFNTLYYLLFAALVAYVSAGLTVFRNQKKTVEPINDSELRRLAYQDGLTGLPNRHKFVELLKSRVSARGISEQAYTVLFIDLDLFKQVNDTYGHDVGDHVLVESANRIAKCLPHQALFSRLGGDEFVVHLDSELRRSTARYLIQSIKKSVARPIMHNGHIIKIGASVGLTSSGELNGSVSEILRSADLAMYEDKHRNRHRPLPVQFETGDARIHTEPGLFAA